MNRVCTDCKIYWDKSRGHDCPKCKAPGFFTMNAGDVGFGIYLRDVGETMADYQEYAE